MLPSAASLLLVEARLTRDDIPCRRILFNPLGASYPICGR